MGVLGHTFLKTRTAITQKITLRGISFALVFP